MFLRGFHPLFFFRAYFRAVHSQGVWSHHHHHAYQIENFLPNSLFFLLRFFEGQKGRDPKKGKIGKIGIPKKGKIGSPKKGKDRESKILLKAFSVVPLLVVKGFLEEKDRQR